MKRDVWLNLILLHSALAVSAAYEILEYGTAIIFGARADAFLGTQGFVWDTQTDMVFALFVSVISDVCPESAGLYFDFGFDFVVGRGLSATADLAATSVILKSGEPFG